ncbi:dephospho-CoA kinase-like isoform X1 [Hordeum vulgare subsp. vulgare]|uniref:Dephospho-CoA kinase n=1 Tax=Hordeum vulgare subsp. vulgare TaxID=112509 RepID=A0A8I6WQW7_HORVV|nr:dephospho-CoA kinase-like isoform X1 [Hordeum vulgare subsp. vulgare]
MRLVGFTGGIASGKSTVSGLFKSAGVPVVDADVVARNVVQKGTGGWKKIVKTFGNDILLENGEIDRALLGQIVFSDPEKRELLNRLLASHMSCGIFWEILKLWVKGCTVITVDILLLFETKMDRWTNPVVVVWVDPKTHIERLMLKDGCSEEQAQSRISAQLALDWKKSEPDIVINNSGSVEDTKEQFREVLKQVSAPLTWKERMRSRDGFLSIVICTAAGVLLARICVIRNLGLD